MDEFKAAFKGDPKTDIEIASGKTSVTVDLKHLRPEDAMGADGAAVLGVFGLVALALWIAVATQEVSALTMILFACGVFGRGYMALKLREATQVSATVRITEESILLKPAPVWRPVTEWVQFDRRHPHRFVLLPHDKTQQELDQHEYQRRNAPAARTPRYYSDSWIVVLEYLGQRHDVAEVMGARHANAILARLTLCDEFMKGVVNASKRLPMRPEDQWPGQTGSVPQ